MAVQPITVSQLNSYIGRILSTEPLLRAVSVRGEITRASISRNGHLYITLADPMSRIDCFITRERAGKFTEIIREGEEVIVTGSVEVYAPAGKYSISVFNIEKVGAGKIAEAFEELKTKLDKEGLFDQAHKKDLPAFPKRIGIVTSGSGAAYHDIIKIIRSRTKLTDTVLFPVLVQGNEAAKDIADTLSFIEKNFKDEIDLIIMGRGGGSPEDMACFNDENLARKIYASSIPIISAVGHEIDFSISDFVADRRAETPTAAAEMAVPKDEDLMLRAEDTIQSLKTGLSNKLMRAELTGESAVKDMKNQVERKIFEYEILLGKLGTELEEGDPRNILKRGYSLMTDENRIPVSSVKQIRKGYDYDLIFSDGRAEIRIQRISDKSD
jgi:exodeoxyribonuclease VII large subunit